MTKSFLQHLLICQSFAKDATMQSLEEWYRDIDDLSKQYKATADLLEQAELNGLCGNIFSSYFLYKLLNEETLVSRCVEQGQGKKLGYDLQRAFAHDMMTVKYFLHDLPNLKKAFPANILSNYSPTKKLAHEFDYYANEEFITLKNLWEDFLFSEYVAPDEFINKLVQYYQRYGVGDMAKFAAFSYQKDKGFVGISMDDLHIIPFEKLIGCESQKQSLLANTKAFLEGRPANHALLVGARGTGKSSSVKSLLPIFFKQGLRLVQLNKHQIRDFAEVLMLLKNKPAHRFILFLDDLSFESSESEYKYLKSVIEGGAQGQPKNVLLCVTSNRRHLIKETWRDREAGQDELYKVDSMNETISLSDRFGLILNYRLPSQEDYLRMIDQGLREAGITLDKETLRIEGQRWELEHSGRSGRIAEQFVRYYLGQRQPK